MEGMQGRARCDMTLDDARVLLMSPSNCIATDLVCTRARSAALENNGKLKMEVAHFAGSIEVVVLNCACWDYTEPQLDTFSQGG